MRELFQPPSGCLCNLCVTKFNRLEKIDYDLKTKVEILESSRSELISALHNACKHRTPVKGGKRLLKRLTPTPKALKKKLRGEKELEPHAKGLGLRIRLPFLPSATDSTADAKDLAYPLLKTTAEKGTQTRLEITKRDEFEVKLMVFHSGKVKSTVVTDEVSKNVCKAVFHKKGPQTLINCLKGKQHVKAMLHVICHKLRQEICQLCQRNETFLRMAQQKTDCIQWKDMWDKLKTSSPNLHSVFETAISKDVRVRDVEGKLPILCTSVAILMYGRNQLLSQIQYQNGLILDHCGATKECITLMNHMGICVSNTSIQKKRRAMAEQHKAEISRLMWTEEIENQGDDRQAEPREKDVSIPPFEILGDNLDLLVNPGNMTQENQRKSLHWFLLVVAKKRVIDASLDSSQCTSDIATHPAIHWIPSEDEVEALHKHQQFYVAHILKRYITAVKTTELPTFLKHKHMDELKQKSEFCISDLIDESENSSEGMVRILQQVHKVAIEEKDGALCQQVVFGGDVLTNERAYSAQEAVQNGTSGLEALKGVIHRPEGLHREMNLLLSIYQLFYMEKSGIDKGSLYQLRGKINRRDVSGPQEIKSSFRSHFKFVEDVVAATVVGEFMELHDMESLEDSPKHMPVMSLLSSEQRTQWVMDQASEIMKRLKVTDTEYLDDLRNAVQSLDADDQRVRDMFDGERYTCAVCGKMYIRQAWFKSHLVKVHGWRFTEADVSKSSHDDPLPCFMRMSLLLLDTFDAYRMGDGDRIFGNAKFEWLYAGPTNHIKYRLWLWRMLAYDMAILSPRESYEYRWNTTINMNGGHGKNIPNDNLVEVQVHKIKSKLQTQGANKSFKSAHEVAMVSLSTNHLKEAMMKATETIKSSRKKPQVDKSKDIQTMASFLRMHSSGDWKAFAKFKDPLAKINPIKLHAWISEQRSEAKLHLTK